MRLVDLVKVSNNQTMAIYELSPDVSEKHNGRFALTCEELSEYALKYYGEEKIVDTLIESYYEGIFQTEKEAYLTAKLVAASAELDRLKREIKKIKNLEVAELVW